MIETPFDVVNELNRIKVHAETGLTLLAEKERELVNLELEADRIEALSFLEAQGTVADRQAIAKLKSIDARQAAELSRVEVSRIKLKLKHLADERMAVQTSARMIELQWKG